MTPSSSAPGEIARLARLHELFILDTAPEPLFDSFVRRASEVCGSPIALITLIDAERQWFKAEVGLGGLRETPREDAFCTHTIESDELMEVSDARHDARFVANPFVRADPGVRFYAGAPLILPSGERVGSLCVLDTHARRLTEAQRRELVSLASLATQALTMRRDLVEHTLRGLRANEAARVKRTFLANMSHELCTPLNAIIGYSHLLGTGAIAHDSPRFAKYLGDIGASGQQLLALVQQVLALTEVESGRFDLRPRRTELRAVLESVVEVVLPDCRAKGMSIELAVEPDSLELVIDPMRLSQVVSHLLSNAIRFSHAGGRVTLRARASGADEFRVEVEDHGIGIAPEDLPRLFTPFRQLSEGLAKTHGGAGLGLALTRRLVEAQGGSVAVRSTPGAGSVFSVTLPRFARGDAAAG